MPIRIDDIAKKVGLDPKEGIAKARQLGIHGARVGKSLLDNTTGMFLEGRLRNDKATGEVIRARIREMVFGGKRIPQKLIKLFPGYVRECRAGRRQKALTSKESASV